MKQLTTSIYTYPKLINGDFLYVDKTGYIYELIKPASAQYFLSRPRRFGKSLLVSTLKAIFQGRRELFEGLTIEGTDYDWEQYPVIQLDMGSTAGADVEELKIALNEIVSAQADAHGVELKNSLLSSRFTELIEKTAAEKPVVILIDEYDKPLLGHIGRESALDVQQVLKQFYSVIKTTEPHQRFVLLTGVSKFSKVSVFSDLNNLTDLTMSARSATLLGYTQQELESNFDGYIRRLADKQGMSVEQALDTLRDWYNGYRFHHNAETVYNPVSVMKCFQEKEFQNFWFETGTPTFLLDILKRKPLDTKNLSLPETGFSTYEPADLHPLPLMFQTGYLTIKGVKDVLGMRYYDLDYPNREIQQSFSYQLAQTMAELDEPEMSHTFQQLALALAEGRIDDVLEHMKVFFSAIPYTITLDYEKYYQTIFFAVFKFIGAAIETEVSTAAGRIDAVVKADSDIYIFEFKLRGNAEEALAQIREKGYAAPYRDDPRTVRLIGVEFDRQQRNLGRWIVEEG